MSTVRRPTQEQFQAYQSMYGYFNRKLFAGKLPAVLLNFSRHAKFEAFFAPSRWGRRDGKGVVTHEISINPTHLSAREPRETAATLVHEMCHLWQQELGTPPRRGYHDREWSEKMLEVGLVPIDPKTNEPAMSAQALRHRIDEKGAFFVAFKAMPKEFLLPWQCAESDGAGGRGGKGKGDDETKSRNKVKYSCPSCSTNVWGKPELDILCGPCGESFAPVDI